jgi:hypothetical protein
VRSALTTYNALAAQASPPAPTLEYQDVVEYSYVAEFSLLRLSRLGDIREQTWTHPAVRIATANYVKFRAARSEIDRLNVEVRRLRTFLRDEAIDMEAAVGHTRLSDPSLADEIARRWELRRAINQVHAYWLERVEGLHGFSGRSGPGQRLGRPVVLTDCTQRCGLSDAKVESDLGLYNTDDRLGIELTAIEEYFRGLS